MSATTEKVEKLAVDLRTGFPHSAHEALADYAIAARALDKCRAEIAGVNGEYHYDCPLTAIFLKFAEITVSDFKAFVATGATDDEVAVWIAEHAKKRERGEILKWSNSWREKKLSELDEGLMIYMEDYVKENLPKGSWSHIHSWFDIYDIEEKRITV